jgi:glycosyltransferase involved in cell wall biosynthesis
VKRRNRIFYLGMITTEPYGRAVGEAIFSGAGERKMISVTRAMRSVGLRAVMLSIPFVGAKAQRAFYLQQIMTRGDGVPAVFLPTSRSPVLRKILGPVFLTVFAMRRIRRSDRVVFYNHALEYLLVLVWFKLAGVRVYLDIEDAPGGDESGLRGVLSKISFWVIFKLTETRKIVVAEHVARALELADYVVVRGVSSQNDGDQLWPDIPKWQVLRDGGDLVLHYGGTLLHDTGVDLFCVAVKELARNAERLARPVVFKVTGIGEIDKVRALGSRIDPGGIVRVELLPRLSWAEYQTELGLCHASLSLRKPGSHMANRTFPSKVIEITAAGLALIVTDRGDVATLFDAETAFPVLDYTPAALAEVIVTMAANPERVEHVARAGFSLSNHTFSSRVVGKDMTQLLSN